MRKISTPSLFRMSDESATEFRTRSQIIISFQITLLKNNHQRTVILRNITDVMLLYWIFCF